jgi:deoxyribodipyrimidine photolyase-related protein
LLLALDARLRATKSSASTTTIAATLYKPKKHHIERLMVLGNFALITGTNPQQFTEWMWNSFIDAAEWVMVPNVIGMSLYADGGMLATKPYASGGAYIDRMSNHCKGCAYDRKKRTGDDACPFTVLGFHDAPPRHLCEKSTHRSPGARRPTTLRHRRSATNRAINLAAPRRRPNLATRPPQRHFARYSLHIR